MDQSSTFYIFDENKKVKEIRTRLCIDGKMKFVIQHAQMNKKIKYKPEFVSEERFYAK
jgi:hypothetical protein